MCGFAVILLNILVGNAKTLVDIERGTWCLDISVIVLSQVVPLRLHGVIIANLLRLLQLLQELHVLSFLVFPLLASSLGFIEFGSAALRLPAHLILLTGLLQDLDPIQVFYSY